jgi:hypothetical protein
MMIRTTWTPAFLFVLLLAPLSAQECPDPHIRSTEPILLAALTHGERASETVRRLVGRVNASDVAVYLMFDPHPAPGSAAHLSLITSAPGRRYLRISFDRRLSERDLPAMLGHELQHAVEIAESPSAIDAASVAALYRRIGFRSRSPQVDCFDSVGAILAGRMVEKEVLAEARATGSR